jgi:hypothetical protein
MNCSSDNLLIIDNQHCETFEQVSEAVFLSKDFSNSATETKKS